MGSFKKMIRKYLQKKGLDIQNFPTPVEFHKAVEQEEPAIQEFKFRKLSNSIQLAENKAYYERLLKVCVPDWNPPKKSAFIGKGSGKGSLNTYRKVKDNTAYLFEKVYLNHHRSLTSVLWFDEHIQPLLNGKIKAPKVRKHSKGALVTIVYFDFLKLTSLGTDQEQCFIQTTQDLYTLSKIHEDHLEQLPWLACMSDYKKPRYNKQIKIIKNKIPDAEQIIKKHEHLARSEERR